MIFKYFKYNWNRFLDDWFFTWYRPLEELHTFHRLLNQLDTNLKFEMDYSKTVLYFLDLKIIQNEGDISVDIYYKTTDTHQYMPFNSCHPRHIKTNIPYNQARRICTIVEDPNTRKKRLKELYGFLRNRGYPDTLIKSGIQKAENHSQRELRTRKENRRQGKTLFMVSTHNPRNPKLQTKIREIINTLNIDNHMKKVMNDTTFIFSKKQPPNLKKLLTRAYFTSEGRNDKPTGVKKCGLPRCKTCDQILETDTINLDPTGVLPPFNIKTTMDCRSKNVIYAIICRGCHEIYRINWE